MKIGSKKGVIGLTFCSDLYDKRTLIIVFFFLSECSVQGKAWGAMKAISFLDMFGSIWGKDSYDWSSPSFASKIFDSYKICFEIMEYTLDIDRIRRSAFIPTADTFLIIIKKSFDIKKLSFIWRDLIACCEVMESCSFIGEVVQ